MSGAVLTPRQRRRAFLQGAGRALWTLTVSAWSWLGVAVLACLVLGGR